MKQQKRIEILYGTGATLVAQSQDSMIYQIQNQTGEGVFTLYRVFPGIELIYNDVHLSDATDENKRPLPDTMEINHCRVGRFECDFSRGESAYLGEGDLAVNMLTNHPCTSWFPLAHYHGVSIVVDMPAANRALGGITASLGGVNVDIYAISEKLCGKDRCFITRASPSIEHIFAELYTVPPTIRMGYMKLKIIELFLFLGASDFSEQMRERRYFPKSQVKTIRAAQEYLTANLHRRITLEELSRLFGMPPSSFKLCFKGIYGLSLSGYMQRLRLETASKLLRDTENSVTEISQQVGYKNTSKFTEAFKTAYGDTPTAYRRNNSPQE